MLPDNKTHDGRGRVIIERVRPQVDAGRFPIKRTVGELVVVETDVFADGHDIVRCLLMHRQDSSSEWIEVPMEPSYNDHWRASFTVTEMGCHLYTVMAWVDPFFTWRHDLARRKDAKDIALALRVGEALVAETAQRANSNDQVRLEKFADALAKAATPEAGKQIGADWELGELMERYGERRYRGRLRADPRGYGRSGARALQRLVRDVSPLLHAGRPGRHGTFADCEKRLPYIAEMGFDVLYLPPIHPIGSG